MQKKSGVYCIINKENNKIYIGSTSNLYVRKCSHKSKMEKNVHQNRYLQYLYNKHGWEIFHWRVLMYCEKEDLLKYEQFFMDQYKSYDRDFGYNIDPVANGKRHSVETSKRVGLALIGNKNALGHKQTPEHIQKRIKCHIGKKLSKEHVEKLKALKHTDESKKKMSIAHKGKKLSKEHKEKISKIHKGKPLLEEHRKKISNSHKGKKMPKYSIEKTRLGLMKYKDVAKDWKKLVDSGMNYTEIGRMYNVNWNCVDRYMRYLKEGILL